MKKATTYTITELKELIGGEAYRRALEFLQDQTGISDEETLAAESDEYRMTYYRDGRPATK